MQNKIIVLLLMLYPQIWGFGMNSKFEEFNTHYNSAYTEANISLALSHAFKALELANALKNDSLATSAQVAISYNYAGLGNFTNALKFALMAEPYYRRTNDLDGHSVLYLQIAYIYTSLNNHNLAIQYYQKTLSLNNKKSAILIPTFLNIGDAFRKIAQYDSALYYLNKAESVASYEAIEDYTGYVYCNTGLVYAAMGQQQKADSLVTLSFKILEQQNDFTAIAETYRELAKIHLLNHSYNQAYDYASKAFQIADSNNLIVELKETSLILSQINRHLNRYKEAYEFLIDYNNYTQKVAGDSVVSKLSEMRAEFEISQNEAEMTYLKNINKIRTKLLVVTAIGLMAIMLLALFLYRLSKSRKQANIKLSEFNEELKYKNHIIDLALEEKDMLMKEIHHRVKNNLQIISSIVNLQSMRIDDPAVLEMFHEMQRRIMAISSIHQKLYQGNSVSMVNVKEYLQVVFESIHSAFINDELKVNYELEIPELLVKIDDAVAIGLIVNELATNAYKYAFKPNQQNTLTLTLIQENQGKLNLVLQDNGPGMPEDFKIENSNSLGLRMVYLLIRQNKGTIKYSNESGTRIEITLGN